MSTRSASRVLGRWVLLVLLGSTYACGAQNREPQTAATVSGTAALHALDSTHPEYRQSVDAAATASAAKFIAVEVVQVTNPARFGLAFDVYFEPDGGKREQLGTFSLFPADNPGRFIVPTQGKVTRGGSIIVVMRITDRVTGAAQPSVAIREVAVTAR